MGNWMNILLLFLALFFVPAPATNAAPDAATCLGCHGSLEGAANVNQEKFTKSVHGGFDCVTCHLTLQGAQHAGLSGKADKTIKALAVAISAKSKKNAIAEAACVQCHADIYQAYKTSVHGQNVMVKKSSDGPVCTSCHGPAHFIQPKTSKDSAVNHFNTVLSCGKCHEEKYMAEKYGFSSHVMERYLESFHGRKLKVGHGGAPSCADCHGAHDIKSAKDPASPVVGPNKISTCAKCHPGATPKFTASITHKPLHPIAHFTEIALIILTVSVFLFVIVHVLLDIYADIRDRLFKKGGKHE
jgi:hypothetical protein